VVPVGDRDVPLAAIANYAALHDRDYLTTHFNALNRFAAVALARLLDIEVDDEQVEQEAERLRIRLELQDAERFEQWLADNHLGPADFRALMVELALCRRVHRWFLYARWTQRSTSIYLDQLRLEGRYREWAERAAGHERLIEFGGSGDTYTDWMHKTDDLLAEHQSWTDVCVDADTTTWAEDAGFHSKRDLKLELLRARAARITLLRTLAEQADDDDASE
jgi:hypothetical protein